MLHFVMLLTVCSTYMKPTEVDDLSAVPTAIRDILHTIDTKGRVTTNGCHDLVVFTKKTPVYKIYHCQWVDKQMFTIELLDGDKKWYLADMDSDGRVDFGYYGGAKHRYDREQRLGAAYEGEWQETYDNTITVLKEVLASVGYKHLPDGKKPKALAKRGKHKKK